MDTREQKPLFSPPVIPWTGGLSIGHRALKHGDYSVHGFMDQIVAERKQMSDLLAYIGKDRDRTIKKLDAMQRFFFKAFLIEADDALDLPDYTQLQESHVLGFLKCLRVKYGFHILISRDRQELERFVLEHFIYAVKLLRQV
uniref:ERCC4 domain-containing protein n=1 Tax=viral metagenome TaxID=1070528 RepID=A0A6M3KZA5_9ZZZZ